MSQINAIYITITNTVQVSPDDFHVTRTTEAFPLYASIGEICEWCKKQKSSIDMAIISFGYEEKTEK